VFARYYGTLNGSAVIYSAAATADLVCLMEPNARGKAPQKLSRWLFGRLR
jgi:hypothetical protein